jgi:hypothetical protein
MKGYVPGGINVALVSLTGGIVVWWGMIEGVLAHDIIAMNALPYVRADKECWPLQIATKRLIGQWARARRLTHQSWPHAKFDLEETVTDLRQCALVRHRLVHSFWGYGSPKEVRDDFVISTMKPAKGDTDKLDHERYLIDLETLDVFNTRLAHLYTRVMAASVDLQFGLIGPTYRTATEVPKDGPPTVLAVHLPNPKRILDV